jgi:Cu2+-exporting ATPase
MPLLAEKETQMNHVTQARFTSEFPISAGHIFPVRVRVWPIQTMLTERCARTLERAVGALPGVYTAVANYPDGSLRITYNPATIEPHVVAEAVRRCGFDCSVNGRTSNAHAAGHAGHAPAADSATNTPTGQAHAR